jgi:hypothetical protein
MKYEHVYIIFCLFWSGYLFAQEAPGHLDLSPENAVDRIKSRNLFHPTRGVLLKKEDPGLVKEGKPSIFPILVGTLVTPKSRTALIRWPDVVEAEEVSEGQDLKTFKVIKIQADKVEVVGDGGRVWLHLQTSGGVDTGDGVGRDVVKLLKLQSVPLPQPPVDRKP